MVRAELIEVPFEQRLVGGVSLEENWGEPSRWREARAEAICWLPGGRAGFKRNGSEEVRGRGQRGGGGGLCVLRVLEAGFPQRETRSHRSLCDRI